MVDREQLATEHSSAKLQVDEVQKALHYLKIKVSRVEEDKKRDTQSW